MNWHRHPELLDRLAAEYALGTLAGGARRRFEQAMRGQPAVAAAAARWAERLAPMDGRTPAVAADDALWLRIERQAFGEPRPVQVGGWRRWFTPASGAALVFGLVLGLGLPQWQAPWRPEALPTQLPESYVGVLATADGRPGLIVSSLRRGRVLDLKVVQRVAVRPGQVLWLWTLDAAGTPAAVAALPPAGPNFLSLDLGRPSEDLFARAVELAVSVETAGSARPATPAGAFVYRGLCGRLWPVKPPAGAGAASAPR